MGKPFIGLEALLSGIKTTFVQPNTPASQAFLADDFSNCQSLSEAGVNHWKVQLAVKPVPVGEPPKRTGLEGGAE